MFNRINKSFAKLYIFKVLILLPIFFSFSYFEKLNEAKAAIEFQWDDNSDFKRLKWFQTSTERRSRNTLYFFFRPSDRKNDLLKIDMKFPKNFKTNLTIEKINLCKVRIGGFETRTKCLEDIPADFELNKIEDKTTLSIYPFKPLPSSRDSYAVVFKIFNPKRTGLYQFHGFGQAPGKITTSTYLGSWTIVID